MKIKKIILTFFTFLNRLITLPLHWGASDYYVPINYLNKRHKLFFKRTFSFSPKFRVKFWNKIAKKHPTLKYFYETNPEKEFKKSKIYTKLNNQLKTDLEIFYRDGATVINNFLNKDDYSKILNLFKEKVDSQFDYQNNNSQTASYTIKDKETNELLHKYLAPLEKIIFNKKMKTKKIQNMGAFLTQNKKPIKTTNGLLHQDRFIPCVKFFYYPTDVESMPLQFHLKSHIINEKYFENSLISASGLTENNHQDYITDDYEEKSLYVKGNSLVIAAIHGLHRRSLHEKNGIRRSIAISYMDFQFTRYDLIINYFKKLFN